MARTRSSAGYIALRMFPFCSRRDRRQGTKKPPRDRHARGAFCIFFMSARVGPVAYELTDIPPRLVDGDDGITYIAYTLRNARAEGQQISIMMAPDEIDRLYAAKQKLARGRR